MKGFSSSSKPCISKGKHRRLPIFPSSILVPSRCPRTFLYLQITMGGHSKLLSKYCTHRTISLFHSNRPSLCRTPLNTNQPLSHSPARWFFSTVTPRWPSNFILYSQMNNIASFTSNLTSDLLSSPCSTFTPRCHQSRIQSSRSGPSQKSRMNLL